MISIVVPCFNEEQSVARFREELLPAAAALGEHELVFVDDGSTDGTRAALGALPGARVEVHERNRGLGAAIRTGIAATRGDWVVTLDADLTFHPSQIPALVAKQRESDCDAVLGSPFLRKGDLADVPWRRRLPSILMNAFYRGAFSHRLSAYTPIFRLYRGFVLRGLDLRADGYEINAEILARFLLAKKKVEEVPAALTTRAEGVSKLSSWREAKRHASLIARLLAERRSL